jgi:hypothetical protein
MEKLQMTIEELEPIVMELKEKIDTILNTADEAEKKYNHDKGVSEFTERNKETLDKYTDTLKKLNGDDFDLYSSAYDEYNESFSDVEEATYVAQLVSEIDNKINKLKEALGEDDVEIHSNDEGEIEVNPHDTEIEAKSEESAEVAEDAAKEDEAEKEEEAETEDAEDADEEEVSEEEKEFIEELEAELPKYKRD